MSSMERGMVNKQSSRSEMAKLIRKKQPEAAVFVDAMSSFGAVPLVMDNLDYLVSSANKCLEGVPGFGYAICRKAKLGQCKGARQLGVTYTLSKFREKLK